MNANKEIAWESLHCMKIESNFTCHFQYAHCIEGDSNGVAKLAIGRANAYVEGVEASCFNPH